VCFLTVLKTFPLQLTFPQNPIASTTIIRNPFQNLTLLVRTSSVLVEVMIWNLREFSQTQLTNVLIDGMWLALKSGESSSTASVWQRSSALSSHCPRVIHIKALIQSITLSLYPFYQHIIQILQPQSISHFAEPFRLSNVLLILTRLLRCLRRRAEA